MDISSDYPIPGTKPRKFRFKDKEVGERHRSSRDQVRDEERGGERERSSSKRKLDTERSGHDRRRHREERPVHRSKRSRHTSAETSSSTIPPVSQPIQEDGGDATDPRFQQDQGLDPDALFRESLFDAMADDEGAAFWSGVYDVPIQPTPPMKMDEEKGVLEQMTEEEYAAHIREQMWRKTNAAFLEQKERRDARRKEDAKRREGEKRRSAEQRSFEQGIEESLRRGRERKMRLASENQRKQRWVAYTAAWEKLTSTSQAAPVIPWPVTGGKAVDVEKSEVEKFYLDCAVAGEQEQEQEQSELAKVLKTERVRWHPDKMQQKLGQLEKDVLQKVVEVFQIVDALWSRYKDYA